MSDLRKALFLIFHGFDPNNGISKKISYQVNALKSCGWNVNLCYMDESISKRRIINDKVIADYGKGALSKIRKRTEFSSIVKFAKSNHIEFVYMRSNHNANPFTIRMVKQMRHAGIRVIMEIPTYPYDQEYSVQGMTKQIFLDKLFRNALARNLDAIVTFSDYDTIFGQRTIRISNGIDFNSVKIKSFQNDTSRELNLIGVAEIHRWHGFDRLLKGLAEYYSHPKDYIVRFHIVGYFYSKEVEDEINGLINEHNIKEFVILHGKQYGKGLDDIFDLCDFGVGSLGRHRAGIQKIKTLKNREYAARGIPFIYSETDNDFDNSPYVLKAPADESPIDIDRLIHFYRQLHLSPQDIRESISDLSWEKQMEKIIKCLFE